jgi:hypothetical protein
MASSPFSCADVKNGTLAEVHDVGELPGAGDAAGKIASSSRLRTGAGESIM